MATVPSDSLAGGIWLYFVPSCVYIVIWWLDWMIVNYKTKMCDECNTYVLSSPACGHSLRNSARTCSMRSAIAERSGVAAMNVFETLTFTFWNSTVKWAQRTGKRDIPPPPSWSSHFSFLLLECKKGNHPFAHQTLTMLPSEHLLVQLQSVEPL